MTSWTLIFLMVSTTISTVHGQCGPNPCQNNGVCVPEDNGAFFCDCRGTGYEGYTCTSDINECADLFFCQHGGVCHNRVPGFECDCRGRYVGARCETFDDDSWIPGLSETEAHIVVFFIVCAIICAVIVAACVLYRRYKRKRLQGQGQPGQQRKVKGKFQAADNRSMRSAVSAASVRSKGSRYSVFS